MSTLESPRYVDVKEQGALVRKSLKEAFPSVTFSVRKHGSAFYVGWQDGPTTKQVEAVVKRFAGGYFDGMSDYAGVFVGRMKGELVHFAQRYVFSERRFSAAFMTKLVDRFHDRYAWYMSRDGHGVSTVAAPRPVYADSEKGFSAELTNYNQVCGYYTAGRDLPNFYHVLAHERSDGTVAKDSPTARSVGTYRDAH